MSAIEKNLDVLQNLESAVVQVWRAHREMTDYCALRAYEAAFQLYRAEERGHMPKPHGLSGLDATVFEAIHSICEWRLGRGDGPAQAKRPESIPPVSVADIVSCLRQLYKSVQRHTYQEGRQGYLTFIEKFLPED